MEPSLTTPSHEAIDRRDPVHEWRVWQLTRLGIPSSLAQAVADHVDWHQVARLVQRGGRGHGEDHRDPRRDGADQQQGGLWHEVRVPR
jgi:hypothetical protein